MGAHSSAQASTDSRHEAAAGDSGQPTSSSGAQACTTEALRCCQCAALDVAPDLDCPDAAHRHADSLTQPSRVPAADKRAVPASRALSSLSLTLCSPVRRRGSGLPGAVDRTRVAKLIREQQALAAELEFLRKQDQWQRQAGALAAELESLRKQQAEQHQSLVKEAHRALQDAGGSASPRGPLKSQASRRSHDPQALSGRQGSPAASPRGSAGLCSPRGSAAMRSPRDRRAKTAGGPDVDKKRIEGWLRKTSSPLIDGARAPHFFPERARRRHAARRHTSCHPRRVSISI
jgi:hypothetical protein